MESNINSSICLQLTKFSSEYSPEPELTANMRTDSHNNRFTHQQYYSNFINQISNNINESRIRKYLKLSYNRSSLLDNKIPANRSTYIHNNI